ncbi:DUF4054 domain-containing protein [Nguyenibacter vanlangensis]|uniref:DUF4054 domain-containing protein n=1 Tax=Nguyenibacter vanlangensis TaxID=1216886 RepID=A0A7Y7M5C0_9PROT|nr:DUF4054 domain-containing protein [Nguyenibacter vanlangensis]NVN09714.1 DUF4054 domain-containing protein [Nguyenibacter vanlangensis]
MSDTVTPGIVTFDYAAWSARFPVLVPAVNATAASLYFEEATLFLDNSSYSRCRSVGRRTLLLYLLTAHLAQLNVQIGQGNMVVGRVSSASRGSVSVGADMGTQPGSAAWFNQTPYGAEFWAATASLRQAAFIPGRPQRPRIWP